MILVVQCGVVAASAPMPTVRSCRISQTTSAATASPRGTPQGGMAAMNPIKPATPSAIDNPTGKTRARHEAMPNRAHPSANNTTVTSHALTRELPVRSALNTSRVTRAIHGEAKTLKPHVASQGHRAGDRDAEGDRSEHSRPLGPPPVQRHQGNPHQREGDGIRGAQQPKRRV